MEEKNALTVMERFLPFQDVLTDSLSVQLTL